jgi:hypothetical protein
VKRLALIALESPGAAANELAAGPGDDAGGWLALVAAALYSGPELVTEAVIGHVGALAGRPELAGDAGQVLALAVAQGIEPAMRLVSIPAVREAVSLWAPGRLEPEALPECMVGGIARRVRRVVMVHNIDDGQGDEIIRTGAMTQALVDCNPELEVVLITRRLHLYSHPRIRTVSIRDRAAARAALQTSCDALIDFFEPEITEVDYDPELEDAVEEVRARQRPFLDIRSRKGFNHFLFEHVSIDGREISAELGVDRRAGSVYLPAARLLAGLGLSVRPGADPVLAGISWPEAERYWDRPRPLLLLAPFGGGDRLKGYIGPEAVTTEVRRWIAEGWRVVVIPAGTSWGSTAAAVEAIGHLSDEERTFAAIGPAADSPADSLPTSPPLSFADAAMRLTVYGIVRADLVVSVEGWMVHAAHALGKAYRVLMLPYSHGVEWLPYGRTADQRAIRTAGPDPPLLEHPRKQSFTFVLRRLGLTEALPLIERSLSSDDRDIRLAAVAALAAIRTPEAEAALRRLISDPSHRVRAAAARGLMDRGATDETLQAHVWIGPDDRNWAPVLGMREAARPALEAAAAGDDPVVRREAARALRLLDFKPSRDGESVGMSRWWRRKSANTVKPSVLILTPVKDAAAFIPGYYERLQRLTYPASRISLGLLEGDSRDQTYAELEERLPRWRKRFRRAGLWKKDFGFRIPEGSQRWTEDVQAGRRTVLAKSRNQLLFRALDDEDWVLWLDVDVIEYPADILERLLAAGKDIVQPHCVLDYGGPTFDRNAWRDRGRLNMDSMRNDSELVELDAVGGTMLLVRADAHREGLIFPAAPYGNASALAREGGELETEGLGILAREMGYRCWGMPRLEIRHGKW